MSRLDELIKELCPDGVEYRELINISDISKGVQFNKKDMNDNGTYPVINGGINPSGYTEQYNCEENTITISQGGASAGYVNFITTKFWVGAHCYILKPYNKVLNRYLYHFVKSKEYKLQECQYGAGIPALAKSTIASLQVPVPPLPIQEEIVKTLDKFTDYVTELQAELQARKQQYEYYKRCLFENAKDVATTTLDKIAENCDSMRRPVTSGNRVAGEIPYYGASGIVDYVKDYIFDGDYLLVSEDGANLVARVTPIAFSITGKTWVNNHAHVLKFNHYETRRYVEMYLNSIDLSAYITGAAQPKLNQKNLNSIEIPLPDLNEQKRIVSLLDRFDIMCSDITLGLPAEIEARQKQYEYYRDKLLSFKEIES